MKYPTFRKKYAGITHYMETYDELYLSNKFKGKLKIVRELDHPGRATSSPFQITDPEGYLPDRVVDNLSSEGITVEYNISRRYTDKLKKKIPAFYPFTDEPYRIDHTRAWAPCKNMLFQTTNGDYWTIEFKKLGKNHPPKRHISQFNAEIFDDMVEMYYHNITENYKVVGQFPSSYYTILQYDVEQTLRTKIKKAWVFLDQKQLIEKSML